MEIFYYISCLLWGMFCGATIKETGAKKYIIIVGGVAVLWGIRYLLVN